MVCEDFSEDCGQLQPSCSFDPLVVRLCRKTCNAPPCPCELCLTGGREGRERGRDEREGGKRERGTRKGERVKKVGGKRRAGGKREMVKIERGREERG